MVEPSVIDFLKVVAPIASAVAAIFAVIVATTTALYSRKALELNRKALELNGRALELNGKALELNWLSNSANMVTRFVADYESNEYRVFRRKFGQQLLEMRGMKEEDRVQYIKEQIGIVDLPILGYFENIAYLKHRRVLDEGMVWNKFFWQLERYYIAVTKPTNLLEVYRQGGQKTIYQELENLYKGLRAYDREQRGIADEKSEPEDNEVERFLKEESRLITTANESPSSGAA